MFLSISDLENNVQSELHDVESADELNQVVSDLDGVDVESNIAGNDEVIDDVNESGDDESGADESGDDESGDDESGDDESGDDESGDDESGDDESDEETEIEDAA